MGMEELTNFTMKNSLTLPSLANDYINSLGDENDEPIHTYTDPYMRNFVRKSVKGGRFKTSNQQYIPEISDKVLIIISKEFNINGHIRELLGKYFNFLNKYEKLHAKEYCSKYEDYRDFIQNVKYDYINNKLTLLPVHHKELSKLAFKKSQRDFDATSLCPSAMWVENSVYPKIETGCAFQPHVNDAFVNEFNNQTFNQDGNDSAILKKILQSS